MSFSEILGDMENDKAIERDSKRLAELTELRQQVEGLKAQLDEENWLGCLIDRLNEFARENANLFAECRNGREASILIQQMHGEFNSLRIRLDHYRELVGEMARRIVALTFPICSCGANTACDEPHVDDCKDAPLLARRNALLARCEGEK